MRLGIIGYTGFIGTNLIKAFAEVYDLVLISVRDKDWREKIACCDFLINLVGKAHDHKGTATESDYYYANLELAKEIFRVFNSSKSLGLIHLSSIAAVEEFESNLPIDESFSSNPISWYGKSKKAAEDWILSQDLEHSKKLYILRPPMVHGPGDKGNLKLLYKFVSTGIPYPLASFENSRTFISINNFIYFVQKIINQHNNLNSGVYHISDNESVSTKELIDLIKSLIMKSSIINIAIPKIIISIIAKFGDYIPIPLNSKRLKKLTSNLLVSNSKIRKALAIDKLPLTAREGLEITIRSFNQIN